MDQNFDTILHRTFMYVQEIAKEFYFKIWAQNPPLKKGLYDRKWDKIKNSAVSRLRVLTFMPKYGSGFDEWLRPSAIYACMIVLLKQPVNRPLRLVAVVVATW